jgi:hypothetical protein
MQRLLFAAIFSGGLLFAGVRANAQEHHESSNYVQEQHHYVKHHPEERSMKRPEAPSSGHVWVGTEWTWSNGHYAEKHGHWALPPHGNKEWKDGHWAKGDRGDYWVKGSWH